MMGRPAVAAPLAVEQGFTEYLQLTVVVGAGDVAKKRERLLWCDPVAGDHPHREAACRDITAAGGDLDRLPGDSGQGVCGAGSEWYDPVTVSATGMWDRGTVTYRKTFDNRCQLRLRTGLVFDL